jgi:hypothetical protein
MKRIHEPEDDGDALVRRKSSPQSAQSLFEHSPLDLKTPSIRLVRILPDLSSDGHVQLEIRHASTKSAYICLSYVWGHGRNLPWIRLDGRLFQVRPNLYAFLAAASKKPHICSGWLWIDALCIDQLNNSERSHQVQQMGHIFSHAVKVISWLGDFEGIARFFRESTPPLRLHVSAPEHLNPFPLYFFQSEYWTRAWITQEFSLARRITFMAGKEEIDRWQPPEEVEDDPVVPYVSKPYEMKDYYFLGNRSRQRRDRSLIYLLHIYSRKECWDPRDRIFSLLALCDEGSDLDVDYDISHDALAKRVLQACSNSFCLCAVGVLGRVLNLSLLYDLTYDLAMEEEHLFGTLSLFIPNWFIRPNYIGIRDSMAADIDLSTLCQLRIGGFRVEVSPGTCYHIQDIHDGYIMYYNGCDIVIQDFSNSEPEPQSTHNCSVSYNRDELTSSLTFSFETLIKIARLGSGATAASMEAEGEPGLRISSGSDLYTDAPDLSLPIVELPPEPSLQSLRSFEVRPYVDVHGQSRYCGVFVYDREDDKDAASSTPVDDVWIGEYFS